MSFLLFDASYTYNKRNLTNICDFHILNLSMDHVLSKGLEIRI